jgi:ribosomal protein S26
MKPKFKVGDKVIVNKSILDEDNDPAGVSTNSTMSDSYKYKIVKTVTSVRFLYGGIVYDLDDSYLYNECWLSSLQPEVLYHSNPKIHAVIVKIKSLQENRKELGYEY